MTPLATLRRLDVGDRSDRSDLDAVVAVAVTGALPREVMPPDDEPHPDDWTLPRERAYARFLRGRPATETSYLVVEGTAVVGVARLLRDGSGAETGVWLARSARGRGIGTIVLGLLAQRAAEDGADRLLAGTTVDNVAALAALRHHGAALSARSDTVAAVIGLSGPRSRDPGSSR